MVHCTENEVAKVLLNWFHNMDPAGQRIVVDTLSKRAEWAIALLKAVEQKRVPKGLVTAYHANAMHEFDDQNLKRIAQSSVGDCDHNSARKAGAY